jgi:hypothetical protein
MKGLPVPREDGRERLMTRRDRPLLPRLVGLLGLLPIGAVAGVVEAADPACSSLAFTVDPSVGRRWPELDEELRQAFTGRDDVDACARVGVRSATSESSLLVEVTLPDGRSATRTVRSRQDVLGTVEALVLLPPAAEPASDAQPEALPAAPSPRQAPEGTVASTITVRSSPPLPAVSPRRFALELSLGVGAHAGDGQTKLGVGASSLVALAGWLVGFQAEADRYERLSVAGARTGAFVLGLLGGRRLAFGQLAVDLIGGPAVALRGGWSIATAKGSSDATTTPTMESSAGHTFVPRLRFGGRLTVRALSTVRAFIGLEGDIGDVGPEGPPQRGETQGLPTWTVGLTAGATLGTS